MDGKECSVISPLVAHVFMAIALLLAYAAVILVGVVLIVQYVQKDLTATMADV